MAMTWTQKIPEAREFVSQEWIDQAPASPFAPDSEQHDPAMCARWRESLIEWVEHGMLAADKHNRETTKPHSYAVCWDGRVLKVSRYAVDMAAAVLHIAGDYASFHAVALSELAQESSGAGADSMRRMLVASCTSEECWQGDRPGIAVHAKWPVMNAAMESISPGIGYLTPAMAMTEEVARCGGGGLPESDMRYRMNEEARFRLRIFGSYEELAPINTQDLIFDDAGDLLTRRPQSDEWDGLPGFEATSEYLASQPKGATIRELAKHFRISNDQARTSIDLLSPEFIARGMPERVVCSVGSRTLWRVAADREEIDRSIFNASRGGHEVATVIEMSGGLVSSVRVEQRW